MIVSHQHKFIFVKTHKTAGSSLEMALGVLCGDADIISHMETNIDGDVPRNYHSRPRLGALYDRFKLVRRIIPRHSPLLGAYYYEHMPAWRIRELVGEDVWGSYFKFCFERNPWDKVVSYYLWKAHGQNRSMPSFRDYVLRKSHRLPADAKLYCDADGASLVDTIFEFRQLNEAIEQLNERLGIGLSKTLPREKTGIVPDRRHWRDYYDDETRGKVAELFSREIELLGYRFSDH